MLCVECGNKPLLTTISSTSRLIWLLGRAPQSRMRKKLIQTMYIEIPARCCLSLGDYSFRVFAVDDHKMNVKA